MSKEEFLKRVERSRGEKPWSIDPERSALLVVDLQNDFVQEGAVLAVPDARSQMPTIKHIIDTCKDIGLPVVYTAMVHDHPELAPRHYELFPFLEEEAYNPNSDGTDIYHEIAPNPDDYVVEKLGYNAFHNTDLDAILRNAGNDRSVDTVIIVGTVTNVCVESTARGAYEHGYKVVVVSDAVSAYDEDLHEATLTNIDYGFGRVMSHKEIIDELKGGDNG